MKTENDKLRATLAKKLIEEHGGVPPPLRIYLDLLKKNIELLAESTSGSPSSGLRA